MKVLAKERCLLNTDVAYDRLDCSYTNLLLLFFFCF